MKIITVVGARPQFIKAAAISRAIRKRNGFPSNLVSHLSEVIVHTGQHYDSNMSEVFFKELDITEPHYNLGIGDSTHGAMTGRMLEKIEEVLLNERPDWVLVYGDTNSTLAGALAAVKLHIQVAHVEAGLRSLNRKMPEEINRVLTDHVASVLFCPTHKAVQNLQMEGFKNILDPIRISNVERTPNFPLVVNVGDVMYDTALYYAPKSEQKSRILEELNLKPNSYALTTVHRSENTDDRERLKNIFEGLSRVARELDVVLPLHPRTREALEREDLFDQVAQMLKLIEPLGYLDMIRLEKNAKLILTDSGGIQKEAFFYGVPCVTLRDETEWMELVDAGWNILAGTNADRIGQAAQNMLSAWHPLAQISLYGHGNTAFKILDVLCILGYDY
ncbi:MAG TPA: UDP-N-acetylglucosamine 2-epimerase (non-hydrolyzing) [Deltaproteobacteria bacterium]|nr:MAG: UDP-N-acetylglucosamine 2-epimerase (non-hydrolyzing) [Deltaproteobacteria bacterium]RLB93448.1 MAG: UDP-N-acetylglucosamine 2-epimerase (non-hydrolyzing) [Deltaproteobacteria bacterium]HDM76734.1 UDP-N-acetylglucosamine 2-epimerase (non-hydrolyzing) [Deltaproteobacteria bacterium]